MLLRVMTWMLAALGLAACATAGSPDEGSALQGERSAVTATPAREPRTRALLLFPDQDRERAQAAVQAQGGRLLATFDGPAAIIQVDPVRAQALANELPGSTVTTEPVRDQDRVALAPEAVGFWNRQLGVQEGGPPAGSREPTPAGHLNHVAPPENEANLSAELEAEAQEVLRGFLRCLAGGPTSLQCLEDFIDPEVQGELGPQLEREARIAREHQVNPESYAFLLQSFDGQEARYEIQRGGHPHGAVHIVRRERSWLISFVDP